MYCCMGMLTLRLLSVMWHHVCAKMATIIAFTVLYLYTERELEHEMSYVAPDFPIYHLIIMLLFWDFKSL